MSADIEASVPGALQKVGRLRPSKGDPFGIDLLGRKVCAENLTTLIQSLRQPFVLGISSGWGTGKTTFVEMWRLYLESQHHPCLFFNAWESDYSDDPLTALIAEMESAVLSRQIRSSQPIADAWRETRRAATAVLKRVPTIASRALARKTIGDQAALELGTAMRQEGAKSARFFSAPGIDRISTYLTDKNRIERLHESLAGFVAAVCGDGDTRSPVVFFIDELDRCRPSYAIELLEQIKHIFDVPDLLFVLSLDLEQLAHSVRGVYGDSVDAEGYLRRFFDLQYTLPAPEPEEYAEVLWKSFGLDTWTQARASSHVAKEEVMSMMGHCAPFFEMSIRDQQQRFTELNLSMHTTQPQTLFPASILTFLFSMRAHCPTRLRGFLTGSISAAELLVWIKEREHGRKMLASDWGSNLEVYLYLISAIPTEFQKSWEIWVRDAESNARCRDMYNVVADLRSRYRLTNTERVRRFVMKKLELTDPIN